MTRERESTTVRREIRAVEPRLEVFRPSHLVFFIPLGAPDLAGDLQMMLDGIQGPVRETVDNGHTEPP